MLVGYEHFVRRRCVREAIGKPPARHPRHHAAARGIKHRNLTAPAQRGEHALEHGHCAYAGHAGHVRHPRRDLARPDIDGEDLACPHMRNPEAPGRRGEALVVETLGGAG